MGDVLKQLYNACDPWKPAPPEHYLDCSEARSSSALAQAFVQHLSRAMGNGYLRFLFSGHVGCGKSSELEQLRHALAYPNAGAPRCFPVVVNVSEYLDEYDVAVPDFLLAVVTELADTLRRETGIELKDNYFRKRFDEVKEFFLSDVEINEGDLPLGAAKVKVRRLKRDPEARQRVREALHARMGTFLEEINVILDEARLALKKLEVADGERPYDDLVLILDNLENVRQVAGKEEGKDSERELFLERAPQLTGLSAHVVYTVPLPLVRSHGPQLQHRYGSAPFVLPMVKVIQRASRAAFQPGLECLQSLLQKRLGDQPLLDVFDQDALAFLLGYSGGHVRSLMIFVREACSYASEPPISLDVAHRAISQTVATYSAAIPESHWSKLAALDRSTDQRIPGGDPDYLGMMEQLSVLEYRNGGDENPFALAEPWYAVNPIVRELQRFKAASGELDQITV